MVREITGVWYWGLSGCHGVAWVLPVSRGNEEQVCHPSRFHSICQSGSSQGAISMVAEDVSGLYAPVNPVHKSGMVGRPAAVWCALCAVLCCNVNCILRIYCFLCTLLAPKFCVRGLWDQEYAMALSSGFEMPTLPSHTSGAPKRMWEAAYMPWRRAVRSLAA